MQRKLFLTSIAILLIVNIAALCNENQIDVNSASQSELEELVGIGPVKAQAIIDERPFANVDELIDVYGIGEITLEKIKNQDLACVGNEDKKETLNEEEKSAVENKVEEKITEEKSEEKSPEQISVEEDKVETISLTKDIKTELNNENRNKSNYSVLYLVLFCFLLGLLFAIKGKVRRKNEFRE